MIEYKRILTEKLGEKLHYYEEVDSTNTVAKKMTEWEHGLVIVTETQTAGRGTYGRTFYSKAGSGIYLTLLIDTDRWHFKTAKLATLYTAVAVTDAIAEVTKITPAIKWVNDLFLGGQKIGGILTEKEFHANKLIIGIGINLTEKKQDFPVELQGIAASLELRKPVDDQAAAIVIAIYEKLLRPSVLSDRETVLKLYKEKLFILKKKVEIVCGNEVFEVTVMDVDDCGRLVVCRDGEILALNVGEVRVRGLESDKD